MILSIIFFNTSYYYNGENMYKKIKLDYNLNELEPYISEETMKIHYEKLYTRYLNTLNELLEKYNFNFQIPKEDIYNIINRFYEEDKEDILFNLGGVINHELYFSNLKPKDNKELKKKITDEYYSYQNFINEFITKTQKIRGSGYTFLVLDKNKKLSIINMPNQDNPYRIGLIPIMNLDVWEHSYFLDYKENKLEYINNYFKILNLEKINERYKESLKKIC